MDVHPKYPKWLPAQFRTGWGLSRKINETYDKLLDSDLADKLNSVDGHTTKRQCATLFSLAYMMKGDGRFVEIGSFKGKSTAWIGHALKLRGKNEKVVAVDPHINTLDTEVVPDYKEKSSYEAFVENIENAGVTEFVQPVKALSEDAVKDWNEPIEILFIDGSHKYEHVIVDLRCWEPFVQEGGLIVMHDTKPGGPFPGVQRAVKEYISSSDRFVEVLQLLNMLVVKKVASE